MANPRNAARVVANLGCGPEGGGRVPDFFRDWSQLRVDVDPEVRPDIIGDLTDLSRIPDESVDAAWAAHCLEHLYLYQVPRALTEICRILKADGFACIHVPDLQAMAQHVASDRLLEPLYMSPAGPINAHDMIYGFGRAISEGRQFMAHRCGFTPSSMMHCLRQAPFAEVTLRRNTASLELAVVAWKSAALDPTQRERQIRALGL